MFTLVYLLFLFCVINYSVASLSDYYEGQSSLDGKQALQEYKHGDNGHLAGLTPFFGKLSEIKPVGGSSLAYDTGVRYGSGISHSGSSISDQNNIYSFKPVHSGDLSAEVTSSLGKLPGNKPVTRSSLTYDTDFRYGSGISQSGSTVRDHNDIYSFKPSIHSEDLSLSSLDLIKPTSDHVKSLQAMLEGSKFSSGYNAHTNNYGALDSISLGDVPYHGLYDIKDHEQGIYSVKPGHSGYLQLSSLDSTKHSSGDVNSLQALLNRQKSLSGNSNNHAALDSLSLGHAYFGGLHDARPLHPENGNYIKHLLHASASGSLKGAQTLHDTLDSHIALPDHASSSDHLSLNEHTSHDEDHSHFRSFAKALVDGWSALLNH